MQISQGFQSDMTLCHQSKEGIRRFPLFPPSAINLAEERVAPFCQITRLFALREWLKIETHLLSKLSALQFINKTLNCIEIAATSNFALERICHSIARIMHRTLSTCQSDSDICKYYCFHAFIKVIF